MKTLQISLVVLLVMGIVAEGHAQGTSAKQGPQGATASGMQAAGAAAISGETLGQLGELLQEGNLIGILSDVSLAKALGLDVEQWMLAGYLIEEYQSAVLYYWMIDPQGQDPATWHALSVIKTLTELELFQLLTPAQQQQLEQLYQQMAGTQGTTTTSSATTKAATK